VKLGIPLNYAGDFRETVDNLMDFETVGIDRIMVPEAYSFDAVARWGTSRPGPNAWNPRSAFCPCTPARRRTWQ
jgi:hypothetical protein